MMTLYGDLTEVLSVIVYHPLNQHVTELLFSTVFLHHRIGFTYVHLALLFRSKRLLSKLATTENFREKIFQEVYFS
jgi:hypothetical protein